MREVQKYRYIAAFGLTAMVFILGMLFSNLMDQQRASSLDDNMQVGMVELESDQLQLSYLQSDRVESCDVLETGIRGIVTDYNHRLDNVKDFQDNSFFQEEEFEELKHRFVLSGIRYWMFAEEMNEECEDGSDTILFFTTSLEPDNCDECDFVGTELTQLKRHYGEDILVFSIPSTIDNGMVDVLRTQFNITEDPTLIINEDVKMEGSVNRYEIEENLSFVEAEG